MKKMMILTTVLSAVLCVSLTGCSVNVNEETLDTAANLAASVLNDAEISINGQPVDISVDSNGNVNVNMAQTAAETAVLSEDVMKAAAMKLLPEYTFIAENLASGWVTVDGSQCVPAPEMVSPYYLVIDPRLQKRSDIAPLIAKTLTGAEYEKQVNGILNSKYQMLIEVDGRLYASSGAKGTCYDEPWQWDEMQYTNVTADSFTVTARFAHFQQYIMEQSFDVVNTPDGFRISNASDLNFIG